MNQNSAQTPDLYGALQALKQNIFRTLNAVKIGQITAYDSAARTAEVLVLFKSGSRPLTLVDCPVVTIQGGGAGVAMPIAAGDQCLLLFSDRNIDAWYQNGGEASPLTARCHDLSDGICIVGLNSTGAPLELAADDDEAGIADDLAKVVVKAGLISVANNAYNLKTIIDSIIAQIVAVNLGIIADGGVIPNSAAAATAANTQLTLILTRLAGLLY